MTENEAIRDLQYLIEEYSAYPPETGVSATVGSLQYCISTLKEIQQYREIGTVEEIKSVKKYIELKRRCGTPSNTIDLCAEYVAIGTVEECREAVERRKPKRAVFDCMIGNWEGRFNCPACGKVILRDYSDVENTFCERCGQAIRWG